MSAAGRSARALLAGLLLLPGGCSKPARSPALDLVADLRSAEIRSDFLDLPFLAADPLFERRGFARLETSGSRALAWSVRKEARLVLPFHSTGDKELRIRARSHESLGASLPLALALNDQALPGIDVTPVEQEFQIRLPASSQVRGDNVLTLTAPRQRVPSPGEADRRTLVVAYSELTVRPAGSQERPQQPGLDAGRLFIPPASSVAYYVRVPAQARLSVEAARGATTSPGLRVTLETEAGREPLLAVAPAGTERTEVGLEARAGVIARLELANEGTRGLVFVPSARITVPRLEAAPRKPASVGKPPNVIVFLVDTLRADYLGAYGQKSPTSPRFDAFAREAILFEDAWAQASWTRSAVASIFTGLYVGTHGVDLSDRVLPPGLARISERFKAAGYRTGAFVGNHLLGGRFGYSQGFDSWNGGDDRLYGSTASVLAEKALAWVDSGSAPMFLYVHTTDPHSPYDPSPENEAPFAFDYRGDQDTRALLRLGQLGQLNAEGLRFLIARFKGEVRQTDRGFGLFLDGLKSRGLMDHGILVFTADHGEEFLEHGGTEHTKTLYQELIRVPLAVRLPRGLGAGMRLRETVQQIDLLPSLLGLAGLSVPGGLPGRDLSEGWRNPSPTAPPSPLLFSEERFAVTDKYSVRADRWKLIFNNDGPALWRAGAHIELYDLDRDPGEKANVASSFPIVTTFLLQRLDAFRAARAKGGAGSSVTLTPEEREQLKALGYVQ
jgi:arylsulfatase A-like enzyme